MPDDCIDLIYLDPPFNSNKNYNLLYKDMTGRPVPESVEAFCDTWEVDTAKREIAKQMPILLLEHHIDKAFWESIKCLESTQPSLFAYLVYMIQRLIYMKKILKPTGSIYLHCDSSASHYLKVAMDGIFGYKNFKNDLIWQRTFAHSNAKKWGSIHDTILFYSMSNSYTWNRVVEPHSEKYIKDFYNKEDEHGKYQEDNLTGPGSSKGDSGQPWRNIEPPKGRCWSVPRYRSLPRWLTIPDGYDNLSLQDRLDVLDEVGLICWPKKQGGIPRYKRYLQEGAGKVLQDLIMDIPPLHHNARKRIGYPTQKPPALLERIIAASSNEGDIVFDPFCGCGTTIYAAITNGRKWIGCDIATLAIRLIKENLNQLRLVEGTDFDVDGIPQTVEQAKLLFEKDPFRFQNWIIEEADGFPTSKKTADHGIDGKLYFEAGEGLLKEMVLSVKGGYIKPADIRELRGVLGRENCSMAGFLSIQEPSKAMKDEAAKAGMYAYQGMQYPCIQLLSVRDIVEDNKKFDTPTKIQSKMATRQLAMALK